MAYYQVKPNQTLHEIVAEAAPQFGVAQVKEHEKNAGLFKLRNEYVLRTGDLVWLPEEEPQRKSFRLTAGKSYHFRVVGLMRPLKLRLRFPDGGPAANEEYELELDGTVYKGSTDAEGSIDIQVPITATNGLLKIDQFAQAILIGGLEPLTTIKGVQGRLANLGYMPGPVDGVVGRMTIAAIVAFQRSKGLEADGIVGPKTRAALKEEYGV